MSVQETEAPQPSIVEPVPDGHGMSINSPNAATATAEGGTIASEALSRGSPWQALQHHDFRLLWAGGFVSQAGSQMRVVAIGVQLWDLTHNYAALGLLGLFRLLPVLALSLFGGVIADALDRRRLLMVTQSLMALSSLILALSTQFGWVSAPIVYGVSALGAAALAFDNPARSALIPNLVPRRQLANALSLNIIVMQVATIVGPMLGGLFLPLHSTGIAIIYWIDALSFTAVIFAVFVMKARPQQEATRDISFKAALEGLRFLRKAPIIMSTMTLDFFATFFGAAMVLLPAFAENVLRVDRQYWGILYAAPAVGAVLAGLVMARIGHVRRQGIVVIISIIFYGLATILFGVSSLFWVTVLALAGTGAADTVSMVMRQTIRQLSTPDELRGRMTSVNMVFYMGGPQLGDMEAGLAAQVIGLGPAIVLGGVGVLIVTAVISYIVPNLRNYVSKE